MISFKRKDNHMRRLIQLSILATILFPKLLVHSQEDQASLLLDLKKARAASEIAQQKLEKDGKLL